MNQSFTLKTISDYAAFLSEMEANEASRAYMNRVYRMLNDMPPGERVEINILAAPANLRRFIGCVCLYIWDTNKAEFSNDYQTIKKCNQLKQHQYALHE